MANTTAKDQSHIIKCK